MRVSIKIDGLEHLLKKLDPKNADKILKKGLEALVDSVENRVGLEASQTVYSYRPKTTNYIRTGRLLGGRGKATSGGKPNTQKINDFTYKVEANPKLKGASIDYAPFVNFGTKNMVPRPFFTNSIDWGKREGVKIANREMLKLIKSL